MFNSVYRNDTFGNMDVYTFITMTSELICDELFEEASWGTVEDYIYGSSQTHMESWNLGFQGPEISATVGEEGVFGFTITPPPNTASHSASNSDASAAMSQFFSQEGMGFVTFYHD